MGDGFQEEICLEQKLHENAHSEGCFLGISSIFECRKVISKGLCHRNGNGLNTWIFEDPWVLNEPGFIPQTRSDISIDVHLVVDLINQDTRQWDRGKLSILFEPPTVSKILNIHLSHQTMNDQVFWCLTPSSEFLVKSAYNAIRGLNPPNHPHMLSKDWKDLWKLKVNARLKNFLWKMC